MRLFVIALVSAMLVGPAFAQEDRRQAEEALKHLRAGQENLRGEMWDKAEAEFQQAIKLDPKLELAHYGLGQTYMATKRFQSAVVAYTTCRDVALQNRAQAESGKAANEQRVVDQLQDLETERQMIMSGRYKLRDPNAAIAALDVMINELRGRRYQNPTEVPQVPTYISVALGSAYFRAGALADAEREYRAAVKVDPKLGEAHSNLAVVCMLTGRLDDAEAEVKAAEKSGFKVNPQLKQDIKSRRSGSR